MVELDIFLSHDGAKIFMKKQHIIQHQKFYEGNPSPNLSLENDDVFFILYGPMGVTWTPEAHPSQILPFFLVMKPSKKFKDWCGFCHLCCLWQKWPLRGNRRRDDSWAGFDHWKTHKFYFENIASLKLTAKARENRPFAPRGKWSAGAMLVSGRVLEKLWLQPPKLLGVWDTFIYTYGIPFLSVKSGRLGRSWGEQFSQEWSWWIGNWKFMKGLINVAPHCWWIKILIDILFVWMMAFFCNESI